MYILTASIVIFQGRNDGENLGATASMVGRICPPGWNRVKVSENLGSTVVALVAPVDTSLYLNWNDSYIRDYFLKIELWCQQMVVLLELKLIMNLIV